jgi:alpha-ketoglutarate-dependent taurine dioxygenase
MNLLKTIEIDKSIKKRLRDALSKNLVVVANQEQFEDEKFRKRLCQSQGQSEYWKDIATELGDLVCMDEDNTTGDKTGRFWIDIVHDPNNPEHINTNQFKHSNTRQPLHTDGSYESKAPNISFFHCLCMAPIGGSTHFISSEKIRFCLEQYSPALLKRVETEPVLFSKGSDSKRVPILDGDKINWNYYRAEKNDLTEAFFKFLEFVTDMNITENVYLMPGDAVFFQDQLVLHGRNSFLGKRWLVKGGINWTGQ